MRLMHFLKALLVAPIAVAFLCALPQTQHFDVSPIQVADASYSCDGTNDTLTGTMTTGHALPVTLALYVKMADHPAAIDMWFDYGVSGASQNNTFAVRTGGSDNTYNATSQNNGGTNVSAATTATIDGVWTPVVGVFTSTTLRDIYVVNISTTGTDTTSNTITGTPSNVRLCETFAGVSDALVNVAEAVLASEAWDSTKITAFMTATVAPSFSAGPTLGTPTTTTLPYTFTSTYTGNAYGVACPDGQAAPTVTQVKAGNCTGDIAAASAFTEAVVGAVGDSHTFTGLSPGTRYDTHFAIQRTNIIPTIGSAQAGYWAFSTSNSTQPNDGSDATGDLTVTGATFDSAHPDVTANIAAVATVANSDTPADITFSVGPSAAALTNGYTISGTITGSGTLTVYAVACNPGDGVPTATEIKASQCGGGNAAPLHANEVWTTGVSNNFPLTLTGAWPKNDVYIAGSDGTNNTSVTTAADTLRSEDANQGIVTLTSVVATSPFAVQTVASCDTHSGSATVDGCGSTAWLEAGMKVDLSAGFADLTDIIVESVTVDTITFENAANATTSNITVTQDGYFNAVVAAGDVVEIDDNTAGGNTVAVTLGVDGSVSFTPTTSVYTTIGYNIMDVSHASDGDLSPVQWVDGDDKFHIFSTRPTCEEVSEGGIILVKNAAVGSLSVVCSDVDGQAVSITARSLPTGVTIGTDGAFAGTPTVEDEVGTSYITDAVDTGGLYATPQSVLFYVTDDVITAPDCVADTVEECVVKLDAVRPWLSLEAQIEATYAISDTVAAGDIISQNPAAAGSMTATDALEVVVSLGSSANDIWISYARVWMFREVRKVYLTTTAFKEAVEDELRTDLGWARWAPGTLPWSGSSNMQIDVSSIPGVPPLTSGGIPQ